MSPKSLGLWAVFTVPLVLGLLNLIGLVGALLVDGPWDWIGAGLLATSLLTVVAARMSGRN